MERKPPEKLTQKEIDEVGCLLLFAGAILLPVLWFVYCLIDSLLH